MYSVAKFLHSLLSKIPKQNELKLYRYVLGDEVVTHSSILAALGKDTNLVNKSLNHPHEIDCLVNGDWIMERTGLGPGVNRKAERLVIQNSNREGYDHSDQIETALCTIPWQSGDPKLWPRPEWP